MDAGEWLGKEWSGGKTISTGIRRHGAGRGKSRRRRQLLYWYLRQLVGEHSQREDFAGRGETAVGGGGCKGGGDSSGRLAATLSRANSAVSCRDGLLTSTWQRRGSGVAAEWQRGGGGGRRRATDTARGRDDGLHKSRQHETCGGSSTSSGAAVGGARVIGGQGEIEVCQVVLFSARVEQFGLLLYSGLGASVWALGTGHWALGTAHPGPAPKIDSRTDAPTRSHHGEVGSSAALHRQTDRL
ncbi:hypothetical protein T440DRAFT_511321 [Plenodomus tracheiphilus IPT5]|uniref:Uncharacterized protein n=1 Tax=Plenodomus tracheiphilus IPT5 TaxID=1408161 RepID=A0A6A7AU49_9PLEO|nr:hypothetical protein T440DRAFT_511321 [Plenodomus tracheiphilus IPT5]